MRKQFSNKSYKHSNETTGSIKGLLSCLVNISFSNRTFTFIQYQNPRKCWYLKVTG